MSLKPYCDYWKKLGTFKFKLSYPKTMNTVTILVGIVLVAVLALAAWGCIRNLRSDSCCCEEKNCKSCATCRCSILKEIK